MTGTPFQHAYGRKNRLKPFSQSWLFKCSTIIFRPRCVSVFVREASKHYLPVLRLSNGGFSSYISFQHISIFSVWVSSFDQKSLFWNSDRFHNLPTSFPSYKVSSSLVHFKSSGESIDTASLSRPRIFCGWGSGVTYIGRSEERLKRFAEGDERLGFDPSCGIVCNVK